MRRFLFSGSDGRRGGGYQSGTNFLETVAALLSSASQAEDPKWIDAWLTGLMGEAEFAICPSGDDRTTIPAQAPSQVMLLEPIVRASDHRSHPPLKIRMEETYQGLGSLLSHGIEFKRECAGCQLKQRRHEAERGEEFGIAPGRNLEEIVALGEPVREQVLTATCGLPPWPGRPVGVADLVDHQRGELMQHSSPPPGATIMRRAVSGPAGLRRLRFHDLRHTFGTRMAGAGVPMRTLQEWMGHRDFRTTLVYADYSPSSREAELVEAVFGASAVADDDAIMVAADGSAVPSGP